MTSVIRARRRAEELEAAVDGSSTAVHPEVLELVDVVTALRQHAGSAEARPRADFAADLRARLMVEAADELVPSAPLVLPVRRKGPRERRLVAAATAAILVGGSASMAAAAQGSLPGDALYPVKRGIERAEAGLSVSQSGKGRDLLHQAADRLSETSRLLDAGSGTTSAQIPRTLADFTAQAQQGAALLMAAYRDNGDASSIATVRSFASTSIASLKEMARNAPAEAQPDLAAAALALGDIDHKALTVCSSCSDLPAVEVPGMFLTASEVDRALAQTRTLPPLDNSHPVPLPGALLDPTDVVTGGAQPKKQGSGGAGGPAPTTNPTTAAPAPVLPSDGPLSDGKKKLDDTLQGVTDGLQDAVKTLLPDTGDNLLP